MIKLSYACLALIICFQPRVVISLPPDDLKNGASGNVGVTALDQQDPLSVSVPSDLTATLFHGATNSFDNPAVSLSDSQKSNLSPNENFDPTPGGSNGGDNTALSLDESTGGGGVTDYLIPSVPIQILEGVPQVIDDLREWFNNPKKPECKNNKHALCCQKGSPPIIDGNPRPGGRRPSVAPKVLFDPIEYTQRRRVCRSCTNHVHNPPLYHIRSSIWLTHFARVGGGSNRERRSPGLPISRKCLLLLLPGLRMYPRIDHSRAPLLRMLECWKDITIEFYCILLL